MNWNNITGEVMLIATSCPLNYFNVSISCTGRSTAISVHTTALYVCTIALRDCLEIILNTLTQFLV